MKRCTHDKDQLIIKTYKLLRTMFENETSREALGTDDLVLLGALNMHPTIKQFNRGEVGVYEEKVNRFID